MTRSPLGCVVSHLYRSVAADQPPDTELLGRLVARQDEAAFTALIHRHGTKVLAACRHVLGNSPDVDDAFQATFLVLWHSARRIRRGQAVGSWLFGVAHRVACQAKAQAARRRRREQRAAAEAVRHVDPHDLSWGEACAVLHEELDRLPERFRLPLLLCYFEGRSRDEAAQALGWSFGVLKGRLEHGRQRLRQRLARRGVTLSAGILGVVAAPARSAVTMRLVDSVVSLVSSPTAAGNAALLAQGVLRAMKLQQIKSVVAAVLFTGVLSVGVTLHGLQAQSAKPAQAPPADVPKPAAANAPASEPARGKLIVRGRVLDPDGKPVAGAKLVFPTLRPDAAFHRGAVDTEPALQATTGPDGRFQFATEPTPPENRFIRKVVAVAPGYAVDWADPMQPGPDGEMTFRLVPDDVPVRGRILDLEGRPVSNALVRVVGLETTSAEDLAPVLRSWPSDPYIALQRADKKLYASRASGMPGEVRTDRDGRFEIRGAGRGRMVALRIEGDTIEHRSIRVVAIPNFDLRTATPLNWLSVMPGMQRRPGPPLYGPEFVHSARPTQPIVGTVRDRQTGRPIAGVHVQARVSLEIGWYEDVVSTRTDAEGRFRVVGLARAPQRQLTLYDGERSSYLPAVYEVRDVEGLGPITSDLEMLRGVVVRGRVIEKDTGRPVRGAGISYNALADNSHYGKTPGDIPYRVGISCISDADGRFQLTVLPGPGLILAQAENRGGVANPYLQVRLDPADRPRAYTRDVEQLGEAFNTAGGGIEPLREQCAYKVIDPPVGTDELPIELRFETGRSVSGTVLDPDGQPLTGCTVGGLTATWDRPQTLKEAAFTVIALDPERPRTVVFLHSGRKLAGTIKLSGTEPNALTIKLAASGAITGRVLDAEGKPVPGATVAIRYHDRTLHRSASSGVYGRRDDHQADPDGRFRIEGLIPGERFGVGFQAKGRGLDTGQSLRDMTITSGEAKDLGDIRTKPYGSP